MGSMVKAHCGCGYTKELHLGGGLLNFTTQCNFPFYCTKCKILFEGNLFDKKILCLKCGTTKILPYDSDKLCRKEGRNVKDKNRRLLELGDWEYICPKCGRYTMLFRGIGHWDRG